jgi:hypothetical protein
VREKQRNKIYAGDEERHVGPGGYGYKREEELPLKASLETQTPLVSLTFFRINDLWGYHLNNPFNSL